MTSEHAGDLAELYAVGALDERQRARIDQHAAQCAQCAARIGEAERTVSELVVAREPRATLNRRIARTFTRRAAVRFAALPAVAAAVLAAVLISAALWLPLHLDSGRADRQAAIVAMVNGHFAHTAFVPLAPGAPKAKVLFQRGADWYYVIAQTPRALQLTKDRGGRTIVGTLHVSGGTAELFVPRLSSGVRALFLRDGTRTVARATLPYRR